MCFVMRRRGGGHGHGLIALAHIPSAPQSRTSMMAASERVGRGQQQCREQKGQKTLHEIAHLFHMRRDCQFYYQVPAENDRQ